MKKAVSVAVAAWAMAAAAVELPTMGWSSWNAYRVNISEDIICRQAEILATNGLKAAGYRYVNIDDGFFGGRDASGRLVTHPQRFPNGLARTVERIHSLGLKAGIYSDGGANTCGNMWDNDVLARGVGFYGHDATDARYFFGELGFDFIKVDFCGGVTNQNRDSLALDPKTRYTAIRDAIRATGRSDVRLNVCRWDYPGNWVRDVAVSWRIGADIQPGWWSVTNMVAQNLFLSAYATGGHYNDMDMLEINVNPRPNRPKQHRLSDGEAAAHFGLWCLFSSPLLLGCDLATMPPNLLELVTNPELIAVNQDPCAVQAYPVAAGARDAQYVFVKDVGSRRSTTRVVGFYNPCDEATTMSVSLRELDLAGTVRVRDLYARRDLAPVTGDRLVCEVAGHGLALWRVEGERRLTRRRYDAATSFLSEYQEIDGTIASARYVAERGRADGFLARVTSLGGYEGNDLEWNEVESERDCEATLCFKVGGTGSLGIEVNGETVRPVALVASGAESVTVKARLRAGLNKVRLFANSSKMCDVFGLEIKDSRPQSTAIDCNRN